MSVNGTRQELARACARFADLGRTGRTARELWETLSAEIDGGDNAEAAAALRELHGAFEATGRAATAFSSASRLYTNYGRAL